MMRYVVLLIGLAGCARAAGPGMPSSAQSAPTSAQSGGAAPVGSAIAEFAADAVAEAASPDDAPSPSPHAQTVMEGDNFIVQAQTLFQIAACGDLGEIPARFDADVIERHCQDLHHAEDEYRHAWIDVAKPMFDSLRPSGLPSVVVYPFGGGDLITVLATFPDATEVTTISLEPAGDIRPIETIASAQAGVFRSFGRSLRDPDVDRPRLREVGSGRSPPASLGFDRNTPTFEADHRNR
jgi:hypothetical protein